MVNADFTPCVDSILSLPEFDQPCFPLIVKINWQAVKNHVEEGGASVIECTVSEFPLPGIPGGGEKVLRRQPEKAVWRKQRIQQADFIAETHTANFTENFFLSVPEYTKTCGQEEQDKNKNIHRKYLSEFLPYNIWLFSESVMHTIIKKSGGNSMEKRTANVQWPHLKKSRIFFGKTDENKEAGSAEESNVRSQLKSRVRIKETKGQSEKQEGLEGRGQTETRKEAKIEEQSENSSEPENEVNPVRKILQYAMLLIMFVIAFSLPRFAAKMQAEQTSGNPSAVQEKKGTILIDAGHGGIDPGMVGASGINEKRLNLVYAQKLGALLEKEGYRVVMTRSTENGLYDADEPNKKAQDMQRRVAMIEEEKPLLTVSIHQNSYPDSSVRGPQVFYYEHSAEGERLAGMIQDSINEQLSIERPRVQKGNTSYYILKRSASVTVIVECGFLSNPQEEIKLQEEEYQDAMAKAICDGVLLYLERG